MTDDKRDYEITLEIEATPAQVWQALTEANELTRWFPPIAKVEPGEGGKMYFSWGEDLSGEQQITAWEPERHLAYSWWQPEATREKGQLAVDIFLEGRGGKTVLRLIHSGFGSDAKWDDEYDSISRGWAFELRSLRHYVENHWGRDRRIASARLPIGTSATNAMSRLVGKGGIFDVTLDGSATDDAALKLVPPQGEVTNGRLLVWGPRDFSAVLESLGDGLLRLGVETFSGELELWVWLASWRLAQEELQRRLEQWRKPIREAIEG